MSDEEEEKRVSNTVVREMTITWEDGCVQIASQLLSFYPFRLTLGKCVCVRAHASSDAVQVSGLD